MGMERKLESPPAFYLFIYFAKRSNCVITLSPSWPQPRLQAPLSPVAPGQWLPGRKFQFCQRTSSLRHSKGQTSPTWVLWPPSSKTDGRQLIEISNSSPLGSQLERDSLQAAAAPPPRWPLPPPYLVGLAGELGPLGLTSEHIGAEVIH